MDTNQYKRNFNYLSFVKALAGHGAGLVADHLNNLPLQLQRYPHRTARIRGYVPEK